MNMKIFTMTHKKFELPKDPLYVPLHVGHACAQELGYQGDDTGENISDLNCYYSELTGFYWIWKNCDDLDYVGTCHYRRYLINEQEKIFTRQEYESLLKHYDLITTRRVLLNHSYYVGFSANHNRSALDLTGQVIREKYPQYYETFERLVNGPETYFGNILVTSKKLFDEYAQWLFSIFFEVQNRMNMETGEDDYHKRVFGFISEFLLLVWVTRKQLTVYECKVGMLGEKAETKELKEKLAEYFLRKDVDGAKNYFLKVRELRPDVLMEASDVTGELRLSMQVIATAGEEKQRLGECVLDRETDFKRLMRLFSGINQVISHYYCSCESERDVSFLKEHKVSSVAVKIAVMIPRVEEERRSAVYQKIAADVNCKNWEDWYNSTINKQ